MKFGFGILKLSPQAFWSMSVQELEAAMQVHFQTAVAPLSRDKLDEMMGKYVDKTMGNDQ